jgi:hypothetical protein
MTCWNRQCWRSLTTRLFQADSEPQEADMESGNGVMWAMILPLLAVVILAAVVGFCVDMRHKPRLELLRNADTQRAEVMQDYYTRVHGAEA